MALESLYDVSPSFLGELFARLQQEGFTKGPQGGGTAILRPGTLVTNGAVVWNGSTFVDQLIVNANVDAAAAIAYSKLALTGLIVNADIAAGAAIALSKIAIGGNVGQVVKGDGSVAQPALYRKATAKTVNTTTAATDLLNGEITVAANVMGATGAIRLTALGDYLNNSGGTVNGFRWQLVFGGTTIFDTGAPAFALENSATRYGWKVEATIANTATGAQVCWFGLDFALGSVSGATAAAMTTGEGNYLIHQGSSAKSVGNSYGYNTSAIDTTLAKALVLNIINPSASASCETKLTSALIELL